MASFEFSDTKAFAFLIDSPKPRLERLLIHHEKRSRLLVGSTSGRLELENPHSLVCV